MNDKAHTILMVEDNENVLTLNRTLLEQNSGTVIPARSLAQARQALTAQPVDLVLLDILLPDGSGLELVPEIRRRGDAMILMLTSKRQYQDILDGLTGGADDYMTKPYRTDELLARVEALLFKRNARYVQGLGRYIVRGPLTLDTVAMLAFLDGANMQLTPKEYSLLLVLVNNEGRTLTAERLYEEAWRQPMAGDPGAVRVAVSRLRGKLAGSTVSITSVRGEGYAFRQEGEE